MNRNRIVYKRRSSVARCWGRVSIEISSLALCWLSWRAIERRSDRPRYLAMSRSRSRRCHWEACAEGDPTALPPIGGVKVDIAPSRDRVLTRFLRRAKLESGGDLPAFLGPFHPQEMAFSGLVNDSCCLNSAGVSCPRLEWGRISL